MLFRSVLSLVVNDGTVDSVASSVTVTSNNSAPVADAGVDENVITSSLVTLSGSGTDANLDTLTYNWIMDTRPAGSNAVLANPTTQTPTFTADVDGTYELSLVVNDGTVDSLPDVVTITSSNSSPVADAGVDQSVDTSSVVTLDGSASTDANLDALTYLWSITSKPALSTATLPDATLVNPTFTADLDGTYVLSLVVNEIGRAHV